MGVVASMKVVPTAVFKRHKDNLAETEVPADAVWFSLDKAWQEFHSALQGMPKPLPLAIRGDRPVEGIGFWGGGSEGDDDEEGDEFYLGYVTPALVKRVAAALDQVSNADLLAAIKAAGWPLEKEYRPYYRARFAELKKAYRAAAESGAALEVLIT